MRKTTRGFTLVELAIVIAILGVLAAIAIPRYTEMQLKSKRVELFLNVDSIKQYEQIYHASEGSYVAAPATPAVVPTKTEVVWPVGDAGGFDTLGWQPDGPVRGQYNVTLDADGDFEVIGQSDCDGDGHYADVRATIDEDPHLESDHVY